MSKSGFLLNKWDTCMAAVGTVLSKKHVQKIWEANPLYKLVDQIDDDFEEAATAWEDAADNHWLDDDKMSQCIGYALRGVFKCAAAIPFAIPTFICIPLIEAVGRSEGRLNKSRPKL